MIKSESVRFVCGKGNFHYIITFVYENTLKRFKESALQSTFLLCYAVPKQKERKKNPKTVPGKCPCPFGQQRKELLIRNLQLLVI